MVAKISVGNSLYGALAYNGEKINKEEGRLLTTNRIYNDGTGTVDIRRAMEDFLALMPVRSKVEKPVVHISLNPHPDDMLTDTELQDIAREYDVVIEKVLRGSGHAGQNMVIRVTDEALLQKTGGILQGMSGSPLVQNGMLVGAVTHVFVDEPDRGYAIFAETVRNAEKNLDQTTRNAA